MTTFALFIAALLAVVLVAVWRRLVALRRERFIREYTLPRGLFERLRRHHPALADKDCQLVARALRQFFIAYLRGGRQHVSMPSQVVDDLWHEFILFTRHYEAFCRRAFGRFLHHTPAIVLGSERRANAGLRRCFWHACREDNIDPRAPTRLPLLFAIDAKLGVAGGFHYALDCRRLRGAQGADGASVGVVHCAGDFGSDSVDGSTDGWGDGDGGGGDGGGDGGGGCGS